MKEFDDTKYTGDPKFNWDVNEGQDGMMETYKEHGQKVWEQHKKAPKTVWTILDCGTIVAGWHYVNRFMYFISNEEWESDDEHYLWWGHREETA